MLFVTFHETIATIYGYDEHNLKNPPITNVLSQPASVQLAELRGMLLANGLLYVVNGGKSTSNILCYSSSATTSYQYTYSSVFTPSLTAVSHPFDCTFQSVDSPAEQLWYVPNQDSNVVTRPTP